MRVLVAHNRYRVEGGEERSVELQLRALERAGVEHASFQPSSAGVGRARAALSLLRGGALDAQLAGAARSLGADVVHVHNLQPLIGPRGLEAVDAPVVLHLHNLRLFCAIGVASRDGGPCFRCHHRFTLPGFVLDCRNSVPESAVYTTALSLHQPAVLRAVERFVVPSEYARHQLDLLGLPAERIEVLRHYLPAEAFAERSRADQGEYALVASRLSVEKGIDEAIAAAGAAGVPLRIAGEGPELERLRAAAPAGVELLGRVHRERLAQLLAGAAMVLMPSRYHEFSPYSALEAAAAGVPVVATRMGGLPELLGAERCVAQGDLTAFADRVRRLWRSPGERRAEGEAVLARARERQSERGYRERLLGLYRRVAPGPSAGAT
jgi:glycosyltransferase involved in cell wall biosynthesis